MLQKSLYLLKVLKNIFQCNFNSKRFKYPLEILPKWYYTHNINIDSILKKNQNVYLLRHSSKTKNELFKNLDSEYVQIREDAIDYKDVPNLSVNLLGGLFDLKHLKYKIILGTKSSKKWNGKSVIFCNEHKENFSINDNINASIYLNANGIHNTKMPYNHFDSKEVTKELNKLSKSFNTSYQPIIENGSKKYKLDGQLQVKHDPLNLNYWHIEIKIIDFLLKEVDKASNATKKSICEQALKDVICFNCYPDINELSKIPLLLYFRRK